jgi:branched-chain amino acid transport system substrate-binding protein
MRRRMIMSRRVSMLLAVVAAGGMCAGPLRAADDPFEIPTLLSLTGPIAFLGTSEAQTLRAAEAYVNKTGGIRGRPVHFAINDIQSSPTVAVQLTTQILTKKPLVILGPEAGGAVNAMSPLVKKDAVLYSLSSTARLEPGGYVFGASTSMVPPSVATVRYFKGRGWKRIGAIWSTDVSGTEEMTQFENAMRLPEGNGMTLTAKESFTLGDLSMAAQLARVRATNPDVLFIGTTGTGFGTILRNYSEAGWTVPVMTNCANMIRVQMEQYNAVAPKELYFAGPVRFMAYTVARPGPVKDAQRVFYDAMREVGIPRPDFGQNIAWDAAMVVVSALRKLGPTATPEQLQSYLVNLHGFAGTNGIMDFRDGGQRGLALSSQIIVRWDSGKSDWLPVSEAGGAPLKSAP